jgi:hypothetical protein
MLSYAVSLGNRFFVFDQTWSSGNLTFDELMPFRAPADSPPDVLLSLGTIDATGALALPGIRHLSLHLDEKSSPPRLVFQARQALPPVVAIKIACALLAPRWGGLFLHAAFLTQNGHGILLTGPSGSGKSTLTRAWLARGGICGTDEAALVLPDANGIWQGFPTPFWGAIPPEFPSKPVAATLHAHVVLRRGGFPLLMKCVFEGDRIANWRSMNTLARFLEALPPVHLGKERDILKRIHKLEGALSCRA